MASLPASPPPTSASEGRVAALVRRHLRFGWWSLLVFLSLGIGLEALHGVKSRWYLNDAYATRRLVWTLAHAHGVLLAMVNLIFALLLRAMPAVPPPHRLASPCLLGASILIPLGFFLGGLGVHGGDPGYGIVLLPIGAGLLVVGVFLIARAARG